MTIFISILGGIVIGVVGTVIGLIYYVGKHYR